jgi:hypothetical protein
LKIALVSSGDGICKMTGMILRVRTDNFGYDILGMSKIGDPSTL